MRIHEEAAKIYDKVYGKSDKKVIGDIKDAWIRGYVQGWTDGDMHGYNARQEESRAEELGYPQ